MPKVKTVKEYIYVVIDEDGDRDTNCGEPIFDNKKEAVALCNQYAGWKVYRYQRSLSYNRKDGAVHMSTRAKETS